VGGSLGLPSVGVWGDHRSEQDPLRGSIFKCWGMGSASGRENHELWAFDASARLMRPASHETIGPRYSALAGAQPALDMHSSSIDYCQSRVERPVWVCSVSEDDVERRSRPDSDGLNY